MGKVKMANRKYVDFINSSYIIRHTGAIIVMSFRQTFSACQFFFPNSDHVMFSREFAFRLLIIFHTYARGI